MILSNYFRVVHYFAKCISISIYATALCYYVGQHVFFCRDFYLFCLFKPKTNKNSKNNIKKQMITQDGWIQGVPQNMTVSK